MAIVFLSSCKHKPNLSQTEQTGLPTDFVAFYEKFHRDSSYQMAHITFPLDGMPSGGSADSIDLETFRWTADKWRMHRAEQFDEKEFVRSFEQPFEGAIVESIMKKNTPFGTMRRFMKRGNEWFLIFYADLNRFEAK
jgi:hypothetical protein